MTPLMMTLRATLIAAVGVILFTLAPAPAYAASGCGTAYDEDGDPYEACGGMFANNRDADDEDDDDEDDDDDDDGSIFVDIEDCAPGKYWMLESEEDDIPMACH